MVLSATSRTAWKYVFFEKFLWLYRIWCRHEFLYLNWYSVPIGINTILIKGGSISFDYQQIHNSYAYLSALFAFSLLCNNKKEKKETANSTTLIVAENSDGLVTQWIVIENQSCGRWPCPSHPWFCHLLMLANVNWRSTWCSDMH